MEVWIPFFQALVWPIFIIFVFIIFKDKTGELFATIKKRIESGSEVSVGPGGFTLGTAPSLEENIENEEPKLEDSLNKYEVKSSDEHPKAETILKLSEAIRLVHSAILDEEITSNQGKRYYRILVKLQSNYDSVFDKIEKVVYHLHPTFPNPDREIKNRQNYFELETVAWGQFNLSADVYFKGKNKPLRLFRYINF